ncbi:lysylphosphatidylglycerol synthase transmembrane domain-containing protein [Hymenobacter koreensis]|uniref:Lysylphosphatidylglycerol synthase transmembrane domain-containing protein n=1 Tax=Hymenobacter koreensis TaxID=1084523 RepID=A0ABP8JFZ0_9BACT
MKKLIDILKYALLLALSGLLMAYAIRGQDLSKIGQALREANYFWIGITALVSALGYFSRAYRWKMQLDASNHRTSYWNVYHAMMVGYLANLVLPRAGEVIRCSVLRRMGGVPVNVSLGTVITERIIDVLVLFLLLGTVLLLEFGKFWDFVASAVADKAGIIEQRGALLLSIGIVLLILGVIVLVLGIRNLERLRRNRYFTRAAAFVKGILAGVFSLRKVKRQGLFWFHTFFTWLVYFLMDYLAFFAFAATLGLGLMAALSVLTFGAFGMAAPVQGGIGVFHLMVRNTLLVYGLTKEAAIAYALVVHGSQTILVVLMGGISFVASAMKSGRGVSLLNPEPAETTALHADQG